MLTTPSPDGPQPGSPPTNPPTEARVLPKSPGPVERQHYRDRVDELRSKGKIRGHAILIAVVSTSDLVYYNIDTYRPRYVYLLSSPHTRQLAEDLATAIIADSEYDAAYTSETVRAHGFDDNVGTNDIYLLIHDIRSRHPASESIVVDITGGTSSMKAGAAMAGTWIGATISTIVSDYETVPGSTFSRIVPNTQRPLVIEDPYHVFGDRDRQRALTRMAGHDYQGAVELLAEIVQRLGATHYDDQLLLLAKAYRAWEVLDLTTAHQHLEELLNVTDLLPWIDRDWLRAQLDLLSISHDAVLQKLQYEPSSAHALAAMLLAAAERRRNQSRFDIAFLVLYRLLEFLAQQRLAFVYGLAIDNWEAEGRRQLTALVARRHRSLGNNEYLERPGLVQKWKILFNKIDDDVITRDLLAKLGNVTTLRNATIFAHGFSTVSEDEYQRLLDLTGAIVSRWQQRTRLPNGADVKWFYRYAHFLSVPSSVPSLPSAQNRQPAAPATAPARPPVKPAGSGALPLHRVVALVRQAAPPGGDAGATPQQRLDFIRQRLAPLHRELNANPPPELTAQRCAGALTDCWLILDQLAELIITGSRPPKWETMPVAERYAWLAEVEPADSLRRSDLSGAHGKLMTVPPLVLLAGSPAELVGAAAPAATAIQCDMKLLRALHGLCDTLLTGCLRQTGWLQETEKLSVWLNR